MRLQDFVEIFHAVQHEHQQSYRRAIEATPELAPILTKPENLSKDQIKATLLHRRFFTMRTVVTGHKRNWKD